MLFRSYLEEATQLPNMRLILEMKALTSLVREDEEVTKIVEAVKKYKLLDRTDFISFSINACIAFKKLLPNSKIYYLDGDLSPKKIQKLGLTGIDYSMKVLKANPEWIKDAKKRGLEVNVWTVNEKEDMQYFIDTGVDYITTNYPEQLMMMTNK